MSNYRVGSPSSVVSRPRSPQLARKRSSDRLDALFRVLSRDLSDVFDTFAITAGVPSPVARNAPRRAAPRRGPLKIAL